MEPATIMVASNKPRERLNDLSSSIASSGVSRWSAMQINFDQDNTDKAKSQIWGMVGI